MLRKTASICLNFISVLTNNAIVKQIPTKDRTQKLRRSFSLDLSIGEDFVSFPEPFMVELEKS